MLKRSLSIIVPDGYGWHLTVNQHWFQPVFFYEKFHKHLQSFWAFRCEKGFFSLEWLLKIIAECNLLIVTVVVCFRNVKIICCYDHFRHLMLCQRGFISALFQNSSEISTRTDRTPSKTNHLQKMKIVLYEVAHHLN